VSGDSFCGNDDRSDRNVVGVFVLRYRNLLAVVETGKRPAISIYDLVKFKHKRRLIAPLDMKSKGFIKIQFTWDSVYLAALTDEPDYVMYYYNWQSSKVESHVQVIHPPTVVGPVADVIYNTIINIVTLDKPVERRVYDRFSPEINLAIYIYVCMVLSSRFVTDLDLRKTKKLP